MAKISNIFWSAWYSRYFLAANGRCWAQSYVRRKKRVYPPHTHSPWVTVNDETLLARWSVMAGWVISGEFIEDASWFKIIHVLNLNICWSMLYGSSANSTLVRDRSKIIWVNPTIVFNPVRPSYQHHNLISTRRIGFIHIMLHGNGQRQISPQNFSEDRKQDYLTMNFKTHCTDIFLFQYKWVSTRDLGVKLYLMHACIAL